jgi:hypothetical protein
MLKRVFLICLSVLLLSGCQPVVPKDALRLSPTTLADRQLQTRRFETSNNRTMLSAAAAVLQDLGFTLEESEFTLGVLTATKRRDATSGGQIAASILLAALGGGSTPVDKEQFIRVSMVMRELVPSLADAPPPAQKAKTAATSGQCTLRVTFQRVVINTANQVTLAEQVNDPAVYKEFFDKLSQSVFLEAHEI